MKFTRGQSRSPFLLISTLSSLLFKREREKKKQRHRLHCLCNHPGGKKKIDSLTGTIRCGAQLWCWKNQTNEPQDCESSYQVEGNRVCFQLPSGLVTMRVTMVLIQRVRLPPCYPITLSASPHLHMWNYGGYIYCIWMKSCVMVCNFFSSSSKEICARQQTTRHEPTVQTLCLHWRWNKPLE